MEGVMPISKNTTWLNRLLKQRATWVSLLGLTAFLFVACSGGQAASNDADLAPDFGLVLFESETREKGEALKLSDLRGNPVVVNFWFPSCPPCVAEMPDLEQVFQENKGNGLEMVGVQLVGLDTAEDGQDFIDTVGVTYALGADENGDIIREYGITGFPTTVFIDENQNIVRKWTGILNKEKMDELVAEILN